THRYRRRHQIRTRCNSAVFDNQPENGPDLVDSTNYWLSDCRIDTTSAGLARLLYSQDAVGHRSWGVQIMGWGYVPST
ncbi:uncharacterized protein METZ01_LOCUS195746, partial [marine metagenome]